MEFTSISIIGKVIKIFKTKKEIMVHLPLIPIFPYINPFTDEKYGEQKAPIKAKPETFLHVFIEAYGNSENNDKVFSEHFFQKKENDFTLF